MYRMHFRKQDPTAMLQIRDQLSALLLEKGFNDFRDAIGFAHRGV